MLLYLLMPDKLKAARQGKYFNYVVDNELRDLHVHGIAGYSSVRILGISMDLKGREKFLSQTTCGSYFGCAVCLTRFRKGLRTKPTFVGARLWLPRDSPLRNEYHNGFDFICEEHGTPPALRTTASVFVACSIAAEEGLRDFLGQCGAPMFARLPDFCYENQVQAALTLTHFMFVFT